MKRFWILVLAAAAAAACTGCTTLSLEHYTLAQIHSGGECRDSAVLDSLASVAADPDTLPSFGIYGDGTTRVQDQATISSITSWTRAVGSFALETLGATMSHSPSGQWTVDSVMDHERLEAMRCACLWALCGPERARKDNAEILADPQNNQTPNQPHFGVEERLARIPPGWVHVGRLRDVPLCARYKGHSGDTWVWVMPDGTEAFAQFTLVLHDIATLEYGVLYTPQLIVWLTRTAVTQIPDLSEPTKKAPISFSEMRAVKPDHKEDVEKAIQQAMKTNGKVDITWAQWMDYTVPYHGPPLSVTAAQGVLAPHAIPSQATLVNPTTPGRALTPPPPLPAVPWELK